MGIEDFQKAGILTELVCKHAHMHTYMHELKHTCARHVHTSTHQVCAFSRDQEKKVYVQNRMQENYKMLYEYLVEKEGYFYLCGPSGPVVPVRQAVVDSIIQIGGKSAEEAEAYVTNM